MAARERECFEKEDTVVIDADDEDDIGVEDGDGFGVDLSVGEENRHTARTPDVVVIVGTARVVGGEDVGVDLLAEFGRRRWGEPVARCVMSAGRIGGWTCLLGDGEWFEKESNCGSTHSESRLG